MASGQNVRNRFTRSQSHSRNTGLHYGRSHYSMTKSAKHTIQLVRDSLFESVVAKVHEDISAVEHNVELFDALLAKIIIDPSCYEVVLVLNEYGDFLSNSTKTMRLILLCLTPQAVRLPTLLEKM
jgi:isocitrate/isopropylmalate dehydrogenase